MYYLSYKIVLDFRAIGFFLELLNTGDNGDFWNNWKKGHVSHIALHAQIQLLFFV